MMSSHCTGQEALFIASFYNQKGLLSDATSHQNVLHSSSLACRACNQDFASIMQAIKFCHRCACSLSWSVIRHILPSRDPTLMIIRKASGFESRLVLVLDHLWVCISRNGQHDALGLWVTNRLAFLRHCNLGTGLDAGISGSVDSILGIVLFPTTDQVGCKPVTMFASAQLCWMIRFRCNLIDSALIWVDNNLWMDEPSIIALWQRKCSLSVTALAFVAIQPYIEFLFFTFSFPRRRTMVW